MGKKSRIVIWGIIAVVAWSITLTLALGQSFPRHCLEDSANLVQNCQFNEGINNWTPFLIGGSADIRTIDGNACHTIHHPCGYISAGGAFVGGIYQQIPVDPGGVYNANAQLILYDSFDKSDGGVGRVIGLDPTGGTDPNSANIVWSPEVWAFDHQHQMVFPELQTQATAQGNTITLFVKIDNKGRGGFTQIWLDEIGMIKVGQTEVQPTDTPIPPTNTPAPATATPLPTDTVIPATDTPVPTDTPLPTNTATPVPSDTPTSTPTSTATSTATPTPSPTVTPTATITPTPTPTIDDFLPVIGGAVVCFGLLGIALGLIGLVALFNYSRRS